MGRTFGGLLGSSTSTLGHGAPISKGIQRGAVPAHRRLNGGDAEEAMGRKPQVGTADAGTPASIEAALRRVRILAGVLILVRLITTGSLPTLAAIVLVCAFWSIN